MDTNAYEIILTDMDYIVLYQVEETYKQVSYLQSDIWKKRLYKYRRVIYR